MISATSPNQEGVEGIDSRSGLDTHRDIGHTSHVYLLVGNSFVLPHQGGTFLSWFATGYISLRNSWAARASRLWLAIAVATLWVVSVGGEADATQPVSGLEALPELHIARRTTDRKSVV